MFIKIRVHTGSGRQEVLEKDGFYDIYVKSRAENNEANGELLKITKKYFKAKEVRIKSGFASRKKIIEIL